MKMAFSYFNVVLHKIIIYLFSFGVLYAPIEDTKLNKAYKHWGHLPILSSKFKGKSQGHNEAVKVLQHNLVKYIFAKIFWELHYTI